MKHSELRHQPRHVNPRIQATGRIRDFNPLETCAARRTTPKKQQLAGNRELLFYHIPV